MPPPLEGDSTTQSVPGVKGTNTAGGDAVVGQANGGGRGVVGASDTQAGVVGTSANFVGVWGESQSPATAGQPGVFGKSPNWQGVHGESTNQVGVFGTSANFVGVWGESQSPANAAHPGVFGKSPNWQGVHGESTNQVGVFGTSTNFVGVWGETGNAAQAGVFGKGPGLAGSFDGNVMVTGNVTVGKDILLTGADCAEQFDVTGAQPLEPGTVVVIDSEGALQESHDAYDRKVAGVVSGGGDHRPAIVLDRGPSDRNRTTVALVGKVYCKVDAQYAPVEVGDLLTASATPGHAMKASDPLRAFGAVLGKALRPLPSGTGLIPVLVALQ